MIARYILLGLLGVITLILLLPAGANVRYSAAGLVVKLLMGPVRICLYPGKKKEEKKPKKEKKQKKKKKPAKAVEKKAPAAEKPKKGGKLSALLEYVPTVLDLLQGVRRRLLVRKLVLLVNLAGDDPCDLALLYGKANAAVGCALPLLEQAFRIRKRDVQIFCDFTAEETEVYLDMEIVACPARMLALILRYGFKLLRIFLKQKTNKAV